MKITITYKDSEVYSRLMDDLIRYMSKEEQDEVNKALKKYGVPDEYAFVEFDTITGKCKLTTG